MSRIYFHSLEWEDVELRGSERAWMDGLCASTTEAAIGPIFERPTEPHWIRRLLPRELYLHAQQGKAFEQALFAYLRVGREVLTLPDGRTIAPFALNLNTAFAIGGDQLKLSARLHGQCEIHLYVEGKNRNWLARIIRQGREKGVFRSDMGWEAVADLLEKNENTPVVTSYSVCEQFPHRGLIESLAYDRDNAEEDDRRTAAWDAMSYEERFTACADTLRNGGSGLELTPDDWSDFYSGINVNAFQLHDLVNPLSVKP